MTEEDDLSELMQEELKKLLIGVRKGKTMAETITQIDKEIADQKVERAKWSKK